MRNLIVVIGFLVSAQFAFAHEGGHGHTKKRQPRTWRSVDNQIFAEGHFLMAKDDLIFVEQQSGDVVSLSFSELCWIDQNFVQRRLDHIMHLNETASDETSEAKKSVDLASDYYLITWIGSIGFVIILMLFGSEIIKDRKKKKQLSISFFLASCMLIVACSDEAEEVIEEVINAAVSNVADLTAAFTPYSNVSTRSDDEYFYVESDGIPDHEMMVGITAWIAQVPVPHPYTGDNAWSIPLNTSYASSPVSIEGNLQRGALGIASNGIPIFNPINASGLVSNEIGELDAFGGHSGRGDDYHYHTAPIHLESTSGLLPIAYAFDGFPVYGSREPDGSDMLDLDDTFHGHEWTDGTFHYHGTSEYPYMVAALRGVVSLEGSAPETQITPQAIGQAFRGDPHGINSDDLIITALTENGNENGYLLEYTSQSKQGSVEYSWDENDLYTFIFNDIDGTSSTETFQR